MRKVFRATVLAVLAAALSSCSMFDYSDMVVNKFALVYGVTGYISTLDPNYVSYVLGHPEFPNRDPNLGFPDADAQSIASLLRQQGYEVIARWVDSSGDEWYSTNALPNPTIPVDNILLDPNGVNGPSKANIAPDLNTLAGGMGPDDLLVFYFSGHGMQNASTSPVHEYFVPEGAVAWDGSEFAAFTNLCVRDDELGAYLSPYKTPRKVVILDTCNSGGFIGNQYEADWTPQASTGEWPVVGPETLARAISNYFSMQSSPTGLSPYGAQVLSAAGRDEFSWEDGSLAHGVMTYFLLEGLQGARADLNDDGHVTVLEAFAYAKAGVDQNWNADSGVVAASATFEPHISGGPVDFVLF